MRIPISLAILGASAVVGAVAFGVWKWRDLHPAPAPSQEMAMAREMVGQWRPPGLTCTDAVTITFHSGNLTVNYADRSQEDVQAVAGVEPNGFIRTYSQEGGSKFYLVEGDTLTMHSADGQTTALERCEAAPVVTPVTSAQNTPPPPPPPAAPVQTLAERTVAEAPPPAPTPAASPPRPPVRATTTVSDDAAALHEAPAPALTLLSATPPAAAVAPPEPAPAPALPPITRPVWLARPTAAEIAIFYPEPALVRELPGSVRLDCVVAHEGNLECAVQAESPPGYGFGAAALGIAQSFRMAESLEDGSATEGRHVSVPIVFAQR